MYRAVAAVFDVNCYVVPRVVAAAVFDVILPDDNPTGIETCRSF